MNNLVWAVLTLILGLVMLAVIIGLIARAIKNRKYSEFFAIFIFLIIDAVYFLISIVIFTGRLK